MSILKKVLIFVGSGLIVIGVILAVLAFVFGGRFSDTFNGERINISTTYENIDSIVMNYRYGKLSIKEGDEFKIVADNVLKNSFTSSVENGVWTITDKKKIILFPFINDINLNDEDSVVTIYIPKYVKLENCDFVLGAGKIQADFLDTKIFKIKVGAGEVIINTLIATESTLECGVGSIKIDGEIIGDSKISCGIGEIVVSLKGNPKEYNYSVKVGIGKTIINGDVYSGVSDKKITNADAKSTFTLDCGIGKIELGIKQ